MDILPLKIRFPFTNTTEYFVKTDTTHVQCPTISVTFNDNGANISDSALGWSHHAIVMKGIVPMVH